MEILEIEIKIALNKNAEEILREYVASKGLAGKKVKEVDFYLDRGYELARDDKVLRIRSSTLENSSSTELTFKGGKFSDKVKSRQEIAIQVEETDAETVIEFFKQLGFLVAGIVRKERIYWQLEQNGYEFQVSLYRVEDVGTFLEIETLSSMKDKDEAEKRVHDLLDLILGEEARKSKSILRSYVDILLEKQGN
ncbi:MAG: class IV adenylate cyclase [Candidatus Odinarchaeota archaeon]